MMVDWHDTIVASATGQGSGRRGIVRMTGPRSHEIAAASWTRRSTGLPWSLPFADDGALFLREWERTLDVTVYSWPSGRSYSGQPTVEFHLPACAPLASALHVQLVGHGARPARPGEFTLRAFLAGRLDLMQAEAVLGLVTAADAEQLRAAVDQRTGGLSEPITAARDQLLDLLADLEAGLDFVDEGIEFVSTDETTRRIERTRQELEALIRRLGRRAFESRRPRVALVGAPNAGKSSLFNALVGRPQALVGARPGVTRDYLTALVSSDEGAIELVDTAGAEIARDELSAKAANQREQALRLADLRLHCVPVDSDAPADWAPEERTLLIRTKADLGPGQDDRSGDCHVSVFEPESMDQLRKLLRQRLDRLGAHSASPLGAVVSERCREGLAMAVTELDHALELSRGAVGPEVVAVALRDSLASLGEIVGAVYTDDLLDRIFSRFCIGK